MRRRRSIDRTAEWGRLIVAKGGAAAVAATDQSPSSSTTAWATAALSQRDAIAALRQRLCDGAFAYADCRATLRLKPPVGRHRMSRRDREDLDAAVSAFASSAAAEIKRLGLAEDREAAAEEGDDARAKASAQELAHRRQVAKRLGEQLKLLVECADGLRARRARVQQLIAPRLGPMDGFGLCELPTPSEIAAQLAQSAVVRAGEEQSEEEAEEEAEAEEDAATRPAGGAAATKTTPAAARAPASDASLYSSSSSSSKLPEETRRELERENVLILEAREGELIEVQAIERSMREITEMVAFFSERVEEQHEDVVFAEEAVVDAREDVEKGNAQLLSAVNANSHAFKVTFFATMSFAVLFLHYFSD